MKYTWRENLTYLFHIVYNVLAVFYATRRRMVRSLA